MDRTVTIPALGRQALSLGCLYDLSSHQIFARKLWDEEELTDDKLTIQEHCCTNFSMDITNSQDDRCNVLDLDASTKLDISVGALIVEGSAKYVNASNSNSQVTSVTYAIQKTTKSKSLNMSQLGNVTYRTTLEEEKHATHVVSSITYGKNAFFKFEAGVTDGEDKDQIAGRLKLAIMAIKAEGEGRIAMDFTVEEKKITETTSCEFFGDYDGIIPPLNLERAKDTILGIEGDYTIGVPIQVTLTPLSSLTSAAMKIVAPLSVGAVYEALHLLEGIEDIQVNLDKLKNRESSRDFQMSIEKIAQIYQTKEVVLKSQLCTILSKIKGDGWDERELMHVLGDYYQSPFSKDNTYGWLFKLQDEDDKEKQGGHAKEILDSLPAL